MFGHSADFNHEFWQKFRKVVKQANPDAIIIAEHYGEPYAWLQGSEWDSVMNYDAFMEPVTWFLTGEEKHSDDFRPNMLGNTDAFWNAMVHSYMNFTEPSIAVAMNELSNHDHSRFLTRTNKIVGRLGQKNSREAEENVDKNVMMEAVVFQMTWPGCPTIYYGDEVGLAGWSDPDNRRPFPWDNQDKNLLELHKFLAHVHKKSRALKLGSLEYLYLNHGIISFGRWIDKEKFVVVLNNNDCEKEIFVPVWKIGLDEKEKFKKIILTGENKFDVHEDVFDVKNGFVELILNGKSSIVLKNIFE